MPDHYNLSPPGTVSKILWHFTGGPKWNSETKCQSAEPKPPEEAFNALCGILMTKQLRLGSFREVVKVNVATTVPKMMPASERHPYGKQLWMKGPEKPVERESAPVCCLADIPIAHLSYHSERYGKIAIGFHRRATVRARFNPVFYTLHNSPVMKAVHRGVKALEAIDDAELESVAEDIISSELGDLRCEHGHVIDLPVTLGHDIASALSGALHPVQSANVQMKRFLAFIKTFDEKEFPTIYCEREWRSTSEFTFRFEDVAMIVLPKTGEGQLFQRFIDEVAPEVGLPRSVPIVPWEDLIEH